MEKEQIQQMIDASIKQALSFAAKKYGDTPTDALQLVPKKYVTSVVAGIPAATPGGSSGQFQYNNSGAFGGTTGITYLLVGGTSPELSIVGQASGGTGIFYLADVNGASYQIEAGQLLTTTAGGTASVIIYSGFRTSGLTKTFEVHVTARQTFSGGTGTVGDSAGYIVRSTYKSVGGVTTLVGSQQVLYSVEDQPAWDVNITAPGDHIAVQVTGVVQEDITWNLVGLIE